MFMLILRLYAPNQLLSSLFTLNIDKIIYTKIMLLGIKDISISPILFGYIVCTASDNFRKLFYRLRATDLCLGHCLGH